MVSREILIIVIYSYQAATKEQESDGDMFQILSRPFTTPISKMLKKYVGASIQTNDKGFCKFGRWDGGLPLAHLRAGRLNVPCPAKVGKTAHPSTQCQQPIPEENSSFNPVGKTTEDSPATLFDVRMCLL